MRQRTRASASRQFSGRVSNCNNATRTDTSGISRPSLSLPCPTKPVTSAMVRRSAASFVTFGLWGEGASAPASSSRTPTRSTRRAAASRRAPATNPGSNSSATTGTRKCAGRACSSSPNRFFQLCQLIRRPSPPRPSFHERHLINLPQRGEALLDFLQGRFPQGYHPFLVRRAANFRGRPLRQDQFPDVIRESQ